MSARGSSGPMGTLSDLPARAWPYRFDFLIHFLAILLCWLAYTSNLFGFKALTESASADWINFLYAPVYGEIRRDDIVVVLATDRDIDQFGDSFPISYHLQQTVLERIASFQPKAVFVDFVFARAHPKSEGYDAKQFAEFLKGYPVPLFLARGDATPERPYGILPEFEKVATLVSVPKFLNPSMRSAYCFYYPPALDDPDRGKCGGPSSAPAAAIALYDRLCITGSDPHCPPAKDLRPFRGDYMRLIWGGSPSPLFNFLPGHQPCERTGLADVINPDRDAIHANCPHHPQITIAELWPKIDWAGRARLADVLRDKIVMYGGFIGPNHDMVRPPTLPGVPGVHMHAMALDNLLTLGRDYKADTGRLGIEKSRLDFWFFLTAYILYLTSEWFATASNGNWTRPRVLATIANIAIYPVFCAISFYVLDVAPINWVGAALTVAIGPSVLRRLLDKLRVKLFPVTHVATGAIP